MSRHVREVVEANRAVDAKSHSNSFDHVDELNVNSGTPSPKSTEATPQPLAATEPAATLVSKAQKNLLDTMQFVSAVTKASAKTPEMPLEEILEDFGFERHRDDDDEDSNGNSSASFTLNMDMSSQGSLASAAFGRELRRVTSTLARFSTPLAHRSMATSLGGGTGAGRRKKKHHDNEDERAVVPWVGLATVMFIDLSGYSRIASYLTNNGGAHALSAAVNAYFETILTVVVDQYAGEVLSFAGDAIVACWPVVASRTAELSAVTAAACALDLQRKCGMSPVPGTDLAFRLHIGVTHGEIEATVLTSRTATSMQAAYHYVCGPPMTETTVVDLAKVGQICITAEVKALCGSYIDTTPADIPMELMSKCTRKQAGAACCEESPTTSSLPTLLISIDDSFQELLAEAPPVPSTERSEWLEQNLVPPSVAKKLRQGFKAAHVAEMRVLCVLFVKKMSARVNVEEWFEEVQRVLDECRCPIVQVLDDDKGTHLIAAVNLYQTERDPANVGIDVAYRLGKAEAGCAVGVAVGEVFCGITGSDAACRWDITGPAVVRACRLMQYAEKRHLPAVLDDSVYATAVDISQLQELEEKIVLKGADDAIAAYTLGDTGVSVTAGIQSSGWNSTRLHREPAEQLSRELLATPIQRGVALVKGPIGVGKRTFLTLALERAGIGFLVHQCTRDRRPLGVLATLAEWYTYHADPELVAVATAMKRATEAGKNTRGLELGHELVDLIVGKGIKTCLVVAYTQFVDNASISFVKSLVSSRPTDGAGRFLVIGTAYPVHGARNLDVLAVDIARSLALNNRKSVASDPRLQKVRCAVSLRYPSTTAEFGDALAGFTYFQMRDKSLETLLEATGGCLALLPSINKHIMEDRGTKEGCFVTTADGTLHITSRGEDYLMMEIYWPRVAPDVTARFTELYDALPPRLQLVLRIVASLSTTTGSAGSVHVWKISEKMNVKSTYESTMSDIQKLCSLEILKPVGPLEEEEFACMVPAMTDVLTSLFTPDQDRLLKRHAFQLTHHFYTTDAPMQISRSHMPIFASFNARLARAAGNTELYQKLLRESWSFAQHPEAAGNLGKIEMRLMTEHRRFPNLVQATLFDGISPPPQLQQLRPPEQIEIDGLALMPSAVCFGKDYNPPMAIGAIAGELQKLCWTVCNGYLDHTKAPERVFIDPVHRVGYLHVDLDALMMAWEKLEAKIPPMDYAFESPDAQVLLRGRPSAGESTVLDAFVPPKSLHDERVFLQDLQASSASADEALLKAELFRAYHFAVVVPRCIRVTRYAKGVGRDHPSCPGIANDCVRRAFERFLQGEVDGHIPATVVHQALMDLATAGWVSKNFAINLQQIRDEVLRRKTATPCAFKSFLLALKAFGEQITAVESRLQ